MPAAAANAVTDVFPVAWETMKSTVKVLNPVNILTHLAGTNDDLSAAGRPRSSASPGVTDDVGETAGI